MASRRTTPLSWPDGGDIRTETRRFRNGEFMAQTNPYSYTERKRIRKSFGKRGSVLKVPYLLTMQK